MKKILKKGEPAKYDFSFVCRGCSIFERVILWNNFLSSITEPYNYDIDNSYIRLQNEPSNKKDPDAIKVISKGEVYGTLGYVGREFTGKLKELLESCTEYRIEILDGSEIGGREINLIFFYNVD